MNRGREPAQSGDKDRVSVFAQQCSFFFLDFVSPLRPSYSSLSRPTVSSRISPSLPVGRSLLRSSSRSYRTVYQRRALAHELTIPSRRCAAMVEAHATCALSLEAASLRIESRTSGRPAYQRLICS